MVTTLHIGNGWVGLSVAGFSLLGRVEKTEGDTVTPSNLENPGNLGQPTKHY